MGESVAFKCRKCGKAYSAWTGIGSLYPVEYKELTKEIAAGKYGQEWKEAFTGTKYAAVDGEETLFVCDHCGNWKTGKDITIWAPNDPEAFAQKQVEIKTVGEWGYVPYMMRADLEEDFHVLKPYRCSCGKCGRTMRNAGADPVRELPCPKCGTVNEAQNEILWD